ncbi:MAG: ankyrin repeat domain-containing protein, partial [Cyanobacteria bacterium]|nr:ankyrin repeat domain-containing protein [Cyanobacteriota bacterium]
MSLHSTAIPIHSFLSASSSAESAGVSFQLNPYAIQQELFRKETSFPYDEITGSKGYTPPHPKEAAEEAFFQKAAVIMNTVRACQLEPLKKIQRQLKTKKLLPLRSLNEVVDPFNRNLFHALAQANANPLIIPKMAYYLLSQGVQPNQQDVNYDTPIFMAAAHGNIPLITFLLEHQIDVNASHKNKETPIFAAIRAKKTRAVEALIEGGAALDVSRLDGMTPLNLAVEQKNTEIAALLLKNGANPNIGIKVSPKKSTPNSLNAAPLPINPLKSPLWKAVTQNNAPMTKLLLDYGTHFNLEAPGPIGLLSQALVYSGPEVIQILL